MSNINALDLPILKLIYNNLALQDKFTFSLINKRFHYIFYNCRLFDTIFQVEHDHGYYRGNFIYNNIIKINVVYFEVNLDYLTMFKNLQDLHLPQWVFFESKKVKRLVFRLSKSLLNVTVKNERMKELFQRAAREYNRTFTVKIVSPSGGTPPDWYEKELEALELHKTRVKYAFAHPQEFIPKAILQHFPQIRTSQYRAVITQTPFGENAARKSSVLKDVERLRNLFMHSILQSQQCNWIFITEIRINYNERRKTDIDPQFLEISKRNMFKPGRVWRELHFHYQKFKIVATGGYYNNPDDSNGFVSFEEIAIPEHMFRDQPFILLSPVIAAKTTSQPKKFIKTKSNKWRFKSVLFPAK